MAQIINLDSTPNLFQQTLYYHQGDIGREFAIEINSQDGFEVPAGATCTIQATKPSGFGFSVQGTLTDNTVTFTTTEGMTDEWGRFPAQLQISSGDVVIYAANFLMVGEKNTHPASTVDGSQEDVIPQLTLLVERVENAASAVLDTTTEVTTLPAGSQATYSFDESTNTATFGIPQGEAGAGAAGVVASAYSASKTYAVGDYVIHNSNLYRCTTAITTAESFTASHWTQVVLADDVTDLKSDLLSNMGVYDGKSLPLVANSYVALDGSIKPYSGWSRTDYIAAAQYKSIYFRNGSSAYNCFYNKNKQFVSSFTIHEGSPTQVPDDAVYMILSGSNTSMANVRYFGITPDLQRFIEDNAFNYMSFFEPSNASYSGVSMTWDGKSCTVTGTSEAVVYTNIYNAQYAFPEIFEKGKTYVIDSGSASGDVNLAVYAWVGSSPQELAISAKEATFTIPNNATGMLIRLLVRQGKTVDEVVTPKVLSASTNSSLQEKVNDATEKVVKALLNQGIGSINGYTDADTISDNSVIFVSSSGGQADISNAPYAPCWLETIPLSTNIAFQIAYPYNDANTLQYRTKRAGTWTAWKAISGGGTTTIVQEVSRDTYNNTYNITTNPSITTDTNGWLQPIDTDTESETGKTDMTGAIMSMLNDTGYCHLAEGIFYVSGNIDIPTGATLEGCGRGTIIRLLGSVSSGYICRLKEYSTIKNIRFSGGYNQGDISDGNIGGRKGVAFIGNRDGQDTGVTPSTTKCCQITGCWFENLDSGIYGYNSGGGLQEGMIVSDCYITRCKAGINLDYWVEYCKFTNIVTFQCYYACINNGGNNVFTACTFHGVVGFLIDNSSGEKTNHGHGSVIGCTFNHIDNMNHPDTLGNGYGIKVIGSVAGFIFTGCQIWYGKVYVESSKGVQLSDCLLGGYPTIETLGTDTVFFNGCIFQKTPTRAISSPVKFDACYLFDGTSVTA